MSSRTQTEQAQFRWSASISGLGLLVSAGVAYRVAAAHLGRAPESVPLALGTLSAFALEMDGWRGIDRPLDKTIIKQTDTDDHISRNYVNPANSRSVSLFVAYGVRSRDMLPHRPGVCYISAGYLLESSRREDLSRGDGSRLPCTIHQFKRGALDVQRVTVLHYYLIDGKFAADEDLLRGIAAGSGGGAGYIAQIQIASSGGFGGEGADNAVMDFALVSVQMIFDLLENAVSSAAADRQSP